MVKKNNSKKTQKQIMEEIFEQFKDKDGGMFLNNLKCIEKIRNEM